MGYKKSTYTSHTVRETLPELKSKAVFSLSDEDGTGGGVTANPLINETRAWKLDNGGLDPFGDPVLDTNGKILKKSGNALDILEEYGTMYGTDEDPGSAYSLRKINKLYGTKNVVLGSVADMPETLENDYVGKGDLVAYNAQQSGTPLTNRLGIYDHISNAVPNLRFRNFGNTSSTADTYKFSWTKTDGVRTGFKLAATLDNNGMQDRTVTGTVNAAGDAITLTDIDFFEKFAPEGGSVNQYTGLQLYLDSTLSIAMTQNGNAKANHLFKGHEYTVDQNNQSVTISKSGFAWTPNATANVKIRVGLGYGMTCRVFGLEAGKTYSISGEFAVTKLNNGTSINTNVDGDYISPTDTVIDTFFDNRDLVTSQRRFVTAHVDISDATQANFGEAFTAVRNIRDEDVGKFFKFNCTGAYNLGGVAPSNTTSHNFIDFTVHDSQAYGQGEIEAEFRNIKIVENDDKCLTVRRTSDNCHAHVHFGGRDVIDLKSPITFASQQVNTSGSTRNVSTAEATGEGSNQAARSESYGYSTTTARTLGEFVNEANVNPAKPPMLLHNGPLNTSFKVIGDNGFEIIAPNPSPEVIIPLTEAIDSRSAVKCRFKIEFDIEDSTPSFITAPTFEIRPYNKLTNSNDRNWVALGPVGSQPLDRVVFTNQQKHHTYTFSNVFDSVTSNDVRGIGFTNFVGGSKVKITNIKITIQSSIVVNTWFDQSTEGVSNTTKPAPANAKQVHNALQPQYHLQPTLVDLQGRIHTIKGKSSLLFEYADEHLDIDTVIDSTKDFSIYSVVKKFDPNNNVFGNISLSEITGQSFTSLNYFVTQGTGLTTTGIGYSNSSRPVVKVNQQNPIGALNPVYDTNLRNGCMFSLIAYADDDDNHNYVSYVDGVLISRGTSLTGNSTPGDPSTASSIGAQGGNNGIAMGQIAEIIILRKETVDARPFVEANQQAFYQTSVTVPHEYATIVASNTISDDEVDDPAASQLVVRVATTLDNFDYEHSSSGVVSFKYFIPNHFFFFNNLNITPAYFHVGQWNTANSINENIALGAAGNSTGAYTPPTNWTGEPSEAIVSNEWRSATVKYGKMFGGADKNLGLNHPNNRQFLFLSTAADPNDTKSSNVLFVGMNTMLTGSSKSGRNNEIVIADLSVVSMEEHARTSSTQGTYDTSRYVSSSTFIKSHI